MALGKYVEDLYEQLQENLRANRSDYEEQIDYRGYYLKRVGNTVKQKPDQSFNPYSIVRHQIIRKYGFYL